MSKFRVSDTGFQIDLDNGYTVSVQFSAFHHCSNRHKEENRDEYSSLECNNAEVAVIDPDGEFVNLHEHDDVLGYQSVSEVIALINLYDSLDNDTRLH